MKANKITVNFWKIQPPFQQPFGWLTVLVIFFLHLLQKETFGNKWHRFHGPYVLPVTQCQSTGPSSATPANGVPSFIYHWTPDRKCTAPFTQTHKETVTVQNNEDKTTTHVSRRCSTATRSSNSSDWLGMKSNSEV